MFLYLYFIVTFLILIRIVKFLFQLSVEWDHSSTCLIGKTATVTGANTGIGFYTALDFAKRGARVILACRDKEKAEKAKTKIIEQSGNPNIIVRIVDFASLMSVRMFAKQIKDTEERLDILVNNAGASSLPIVTTKDGLNLLMQVNYFGPFLLTVLLTDLLKKSAPSRIVNVSSILSHASKLNLDDLDALPSLYSQTINYSNSKLCNIIFTNELARKLRGSGVVVNSVHPGFIITEIFRQMGFIFKQFCFKSLYVFFKSPKQGAQTSIYVAVSKDIDGVSGEYFDNCKIAWLPPMPKIARDEEVTKKVWKKTEEYVRLTDEERQML